MDQPGALFSLFRAMVANFYQGLYDEFEGVKIIVIDGDLMTFLCLLFRNCLEFFYMVRLDKSLIHAIKLQNFKAFTKHEDWEL